MKKGEQLDRFLSTAVEQTFDGIAIASLDREILYTNQAWADMHGYDSPADLIGLSVPVFHNQEQMEECVKPFFREVFAKGQKAGIVGHIRRDGTPFTTLMTTNLLKNDQGTPVAILGIAKDVTALKQAEEELVEEKKRLAESQRIAKIGSFEHNLATNKEVWSDELYSLCGLDLTKDRGNFDLFFSMVHPEDQPGIVKALEEVKQLNMPYDVEFRLTCRDGTVKIFHAQGKLMPDSKGDPVILFGTIRDITEFKKVEEELKQHRYHLEQQVKMRTKELEQQAAQLHESNIALKVLLQRREEDKQEIEKRMLLNTQNLVLPYLEKLRNVKSGAEINAYIEIIELNLKEILSTFAHSLTANYAKLSPAEMQIADLIRQGKTTKEIAHILTLSPTTIATHRQNIRKKLDITNQKKNLRSFLAAHQE